MNTVFPVRAIDVGFGNTKYVVSSTVSEVQCALFPSLAPVAASNDLTGGVLQRRNTVAIEVNGVKYEIGKDSAIAQGANPTRILDPSFAKSDCYIALIRGALYYMGATEIHNLVVGLPVSTINDFREGLVKALIGNHPIPSAAPSCGTVLVKVHHVIALPQPLGAFFDYAHHADTFKQMESQMNLIVDPGFFTLDWLLCHGVKPLDKRSGAHNGGVSSILRAIADELSRELKFHLTDITELDDALRQKRNPRFFGKEVDITRYRPLVTTKTREAVASLASRIGSTADIDNVILAGGGAALYREAIQAVFPHHKILVAADPVFANVRGFQRTGERWIQGSVPDRANH